MTYSQQYGLSAINLSGSQYTVEQTGRDQNFRPAYEARDVAGDMIFRTTYQVSEEQDEFPFVDADGTEICRVKAIDTWDIAGAAVWYAAVFIVPLAFFAFVLALPTG